MDLKLVEHAKGYIDALANGVNPLTGEPVPESDTVNQVRISRCLFYVSDVLSEVLQNGGVKKSGSSELPFDLSAVDLSALTFFEEPVGIKVFTDAINALRPDGMKRLNPAVLTNWLVEQGYLRVETANDKKRKRLAALGAQIGISEVERNGEYGHYFHLLYAESAQRFLIDRLPEIVGGKEMKNDL